MLWLIHYCDDRLQNAYMDMASFPDMTLNPRNSSDMSEIKASVRQLHQFVKRADQDPKNAMMRERNYAKRLAIKVLAK